MRKFRGKEFVVLAILYYELSLMPQRKLWIERREIKYNSPACYNNIMDIFIISGGKRSAGYINDIAHLMYLGLAGHKLLYCSPEKTVVITFTYTTEMHILMCDSFSCSSKGNTALLSKIIKKP